MRRLAFLLSVLFAIASIAFAAPAWASKAKVEVAAVEFGKSAEKQSQKRVSSTIRRQAARAAKHLDFGTTNKVEITFVVRDVAVAEEDGVLTVTCTLLGKLKGGGSARSKIRFGGKPDAKKKIERQVVAAATDGVMTRLAQLSRERIAEKAKEKQDD
ncbi:MAG: hypothetical protein HOV80_20505 [Polyangiaceae bacterium]|nr:hypothetical protein [Polyangiaceae bacterium]